MHRRTRPAAFRVRLACLAAFALPGCQAADPPSPAGEAPAVSPASALRPLRLVRVAEHLESGRNAAQANYAETQARCREAGWRVEPLAADAVAKLGTARYELAMDADHRLARTTTWDWTPASPELDSLCRFRLVETVQEAYVDRRISGGDAGEGWREQPTAPGELDVIPIDAGDADAARQVRVAIGWTEAGARAVAGQPCAAIRSADGVQVCMWSAGGAWGLDESPTAMNPATTAPDTHPGALLLAQEPADGTGLRVSTASFSVGVPLPAAALTPRRRGAAAP